MELNYCFTYHINCQIMEHQNNQIKIALADDHVLLRNALSGLIESFEDCVVTCQASNGKELVDAVRSGVSFDLAILDLNMPLMDGYETALWLQANYPSVNTLMLTMYDSELSLIRMLQAGVKGFLKKDIHPSELKFAIISVMETGFYYSNNTTGRMANLFRQNKTGNMNLQNSVLSEPEISFLKFACSDLTYKEIALKMGLNPRSIDTLRDHLFLKFDVRSRVGLAMIALKNGVVTI